MFAPGGELGGQHDDGDLNIGELLGTGAVPFDSIRDSRKPVIAAVNGLCMGGGLLITMLSDIAIASERAVFGAPELRRGVADAYHAAILPEHVGVAIARDMLFTGRRLTAPEAERHGSSPASCRHEQLIPTTEEVVRELLYAAPRARVALKRLINARYGVDRPDHVRRVGARRRGGRGLPGVRREAPAGVGSRRRPARGPRLTSSAVADRARWLLLTHEGRITLAVVYSHRCGRLDRHLHDHAQPALRRSASSRSPASGCCGHAGACSALTVSARPARVRRRRRP